MDSIDYYNQYASLYFENTVNLDMGETAKKFMELVEEGGNILDLGCGSGRDSKLFMEHGFEVTAMDASSEMCELAGIHTGLDVLLLDARQMEFEEVFDGIWACSSLLHITPVELAEVLKRIEKSLAPGGVFYMSVKKGEEQGFRNKRYFADYEKEELERLCEENTNLTVLETWNTLDIRSDRANQTMWSNLLAKKIVR